MAEGKAKPKRAKPKTLNLERLVLELDNRISALEEQVTAILEWVNLAAPHIPGGPAPKGPPAIILPLRLGGPSPAEELTAAITREVRDAAGANYVEGVVNHVKEENDAE